MLSMYAHAQNAINANERERCNTVRSTSEMKNGVKEVYIIMIVIHHRTHELKL